jgi:hypothetical protein
MSAPKNPKAKAKAKAAVISATLDKAQDDTSVVTGTRPQLGIFRTEKNRTTVGGIADPYKYKTESIDTSGYSKGKPSYQIKTVEGESDELGLNKINKTSSKTVSRKDVPSIISNMKKVATKTKANERKR